VTSIEFIAQAAAFVLAAIDRVADTADLEQHDVQPLAGHEEKRCEKSRTVERE